MNYIKLKNSLKDYTIFSLNDIKMIDSSFYLRRLNEWQDKGYIKKIIRGYYVFSDLEINEYVFLKLLIKYIIHLIFPQKWLFPIII